jgi:hypothetical protein
MGSTILANQENTDKDTIKEEVIIDANNIEDSVIVEIERVEEPKEEVAKPKKIKKTKEQIIKEKKANQFFTPEVLEPVDANVTDENITKVDGNITFDFKSRTVDILTEDNPPIKEIEVKKGNLVAIKSKPIPTTIKQVSYKEDKGYRQPRKVIKLEVKPHKSKPKYLGDYRYYYNKGLKEAKHKRYTQAMASYKKSIELNRSFSWSYYNIGYIYKIRHQYKTAIKWFDKAINKNPSFFYSYYDRANSYMQLHKYQKAINDLNVALELDKTSVKAYEDMAYCYDKLKK